jgi:hypothetical protein
MLIKALPPEEARVQVGKHPVGTRAFFAPHIVPSALHDLARLREDVR